MKASTSSLFTHGNAKSAQTAPTSRECSTTTSKIQTSSPSHHADTGPAYELERARQFQADVQAYQSRSSMQKSYAKVTTSGHLQPMRAQDNNSSSCEERLRFVTSKISLSVCKLSGQETNSTRRIACHHHQHSINCCLILRYSPLVSCKILKSPSTIIYKYCEYHSF
jgi:hypothetical protein